MTNVNDSDDSKKVNGEQQRQTLYPVGTTTRVVHQTEIGSIFKERYDEIHRIHGIQRIWTPVFR